MQPRKRLALAGLSIVAVIACLAIIYCVHLGLPSEPGNIIRLTNELSEKVKRVGGAEQVAKDAQRLLAFFATNDDWFLPDYRSNDFPVICGLGNAVKVERDRNGTAKAIRVRYGTHRNTHFDLYLS
jgi:hypothetical protein